MYTHTHTHTHTKPGMKTVTAALIVIAKAANFSSVHQQCKDKDIVYYSPIGPIGNDNEYPTARGSICCESQKPKSEGKKTDAAEFQGYKF